MIKALIFDFDGLILDTETTEYRSWERIFQQFDCCLPLEEWMEYVGVAWGSFDPCAYLEGKIGRPLDREAVHAEHRAYFHRQLAIQTTLPGVLDYLHAAKSLGLRVGLASSSPRAWVVGHLDRLGLTERFEAMKCAEDVPAVKPDPALYHAVLAAFAVSANEAIALEDSPNGVLAATRAGLYCVAVPNALLREQAYPHADLHLASLADLSLEALVRIVMKNTL